MTYGNYTKTILTIIFVILYSDTCLGELSADDQTELIKSLSNTFHIKSIILLTQDEIPGEVFDVWKNLNEFPEFFTCLLNLKSFRRNIKEITGERTLVVLPMDDIALGEIASVSNAMSLSEFTWLCLSFTSTLNATYFKDVHIPFNAKFLYASYEKDEVVINDVYQVGEESTKLVEYYGTWEHGNGLVAVEREFFERRRNFVQTRLKFALKNNVPDPFDPCFFGFLDENTDPPVYECLFYNLLKDLEASFNFTMELILYPLNGSVNPALMLLEKLHKREIHGTAAPFVMTSDRLLNNEFLWPITSTNLVAFTRVPEEEIKFTSYVRPFHFHIWMFTLSWLVIAAMVMVLAKYIVLKVVLKKNFALVRDGFDYLNSSFSALCSQPLCIDLEDRITFRVLMIVLNILPLFLLRAYSGSLISFLGSPAPSIPFSNLREFEENGQYKLIALEPSFTYTFLSTDPKFAKAREKNLVWAGDKMPSNDQFGFALICKNDLTYIVGQPALLKSPPGCNTFLMDENFGRFFSAMALSKGSPYSELFNRVLQRRRICGIHLTETKKLVLEKMEVDIVLKSWEDSKRVFFAKNFDHSRSFTFQDVLPIFVVLAVGLVLSIILLFGEIVCGALFKT